MTVAAPLTSAQVEAITVVKARTDFCIFAEFVCKDDETGEPIKMAPIHRHWAKLCEEHKRLLIWSHINSGKTTQLSILRTVWELGKNPRLRFAILSNTSSIAIKIVRAIAGYIKNSPEVRKVFPNLRPDPEGPWTNSELTVVRGGGIKDPSVRAVGVHGSLTSGRVDRLIIDDILDPENTDTEQNRKSLEGWYKAVAVGRLTPNAKVLVVGTAYHPQDLLHKLARQRGMRAVRFPVINSAGIVAWPDAWPPERIAEMREELGPAEFARQLLCRARDDDEARFKQAWIDIAMEKGEGLKLIYSLETVPEGCRTFTGVDLASSRKRKSDETVFFTFIEDTKGNRLLLWIEAGKFTANDIVRKALEHRQRYHGTIIVENNGAQDFIYQLLEEGDRDLPVVPHTTTKAKHDPILGVEGLAGELQKGRWIIPNDHKKVGVQVDIWISEMLFYSPKAHTGDRLMACYFARDYARKVLGSRSGPRVNARIIGEDRVSGSVRDADGRTELEKIFDVPSTDGAPEPAEKE